MEPCLLGFWGPPLSHGLPACAGLAIDFEHGNLRTRHSPVMYDVERVLVLHQTKNALGGAFGSAGCELVYIVSASDVCSAGHYATRSEKTLEAL